MLRTALLSLALMTAGLPAMAQPAASAPLPYVRPAPLGELVDIGGRRLHVECKGDAPGPVVIFEAGLSQFTAHSTYGKAQDLIAPFARVCIYDRAGLGWSDPVPGRRTEEDMVEDLRRLMLAKRISGPVVLVGHSMGGLLARLYAKRHPEQVAGVVLVDASSETFRFSAAAPASRAASVAQIDAAMKDKPDGAPVAPLPAGTPPADIMVFTPEILRTVKQEYEAMAFVAEDVREARSYGALGDKPLAVIRRGVTATPPTEIDTAWRRAQEDMVSLSSRGFMVVAEKSGHVPTVTEPQVVADTVRRVVDQVRNR
jgi:pimeloyl-ACP methyl ester carboxylesterase